ncbi:MAG TPA: lipase maturation factor family protein [Myxococcales bacterium]|nr:lipase maturation factor family protein [Myxococcales bacterium]
MLWPRWIWLRALGLIFLSAFYSLAFQITGLNGTRGILPAGEYLAELRGAFGLSRALWTAPTLFWISASDPALLAVTFLGAAASVLLVLNVAPRISLAAASVCFLSFIGSAQDFASYQSDGMLLEAAFLSLFLAPRGLRPGLGASDPPSHLAVFLLVWEWFRIYFESGVVKILSGDPQWRALTAMDHYYENGPLPSFIGWYVQQRLPHGFHVFTAALTLVFELGIVWLAFLPRRFRIACFCLVAPFQAAIILTANYAFLNYLVLCLGILLLDDRFLRLRAPEAPPGPASWPARVALGWILYASIAIAPGIAHRLPAPLLWPAVVLEPFRIANRYGLFAVMTTERYEIEFQGSRDGAHWTAYPFRYKPQDPMQAPGIYAPYQPRFEWNLWFASLGHWRANPWVVRTELRLLEGSPPVLRLFASDPFAGEPPAYVRAVKWQYWFTTPEEKRATGAWWRREERGLYAPELHIGIAGIEAVGTPP